MIVTIEGKPGEGKTAIAFILDRELSKLGFRVKRTNSEPDAHKYDSIPPEELDQFFSKFASGRKVTVIERSTNNRPQG